MDLQNYLDGSHMFLKIENSLEQLAKSDSSIQYTPHIRKEFDLVVEGLNIIKQKTGYKILINKPSHYFGEDVEE